MKTIQKDIIYWFIIAVLAIMLFLTCKRSNNNPAGIVSVTTITKVDTIPGKSIDRPVPVPYAIHDTFTKHDTIPGEPYPVEVLKEKLTEAKIPLAYYDDTLHLGDAGIICLEDTIQGLLKGRNYSYSLFQKNTFTNQVQEESKRLKLFLGLEYTYPINYLSAAAMLQLKNDNLIKLGYGYANKQPQYSLSYFFKIKLK